MSTFTESILPLSPKDRTSNGSTVPANLLEEEFKKPLPPPKSTPRTLIGNLSQGTEAPTPKRLIKSLTAADSTPISSDKTRKAQQPDEPDTLHSPASAKSAQTESEAAIETFQSQRESHVFESIQKFGEDIAMLDQEWARLAKEAERISERINEFVPNERYEQVLRLLDDQEVCSVLFCFPSFPLQLGKN
jgi:hypothetical protein